jgi:hypothetical protein
MSELYSQAGNDMESLRKQNRVIKFLAVLFLSLVSLYLISTFSVIPVNSDAGYYIPISKAVMNGSTPTVDVETSYTPFIYYAYALWIKFFGSDVSTLILLMYVINLLNVMLFYAIVSRFIDVKIIRFVLAVSYYFTIMVCQGFNIVLEPFQMTFILLAFFFYLSSIRKLYKYLLMGFSLGIAIMFKQYSILILGGVLLTLVMDHCRIKPIRFREILGAVGMILVFSVIPFFMFLILTSADMIDALYSFGFLGKKAISYSVVEDLSNGTRLLNIVIKIVHLNWLFIPVLAYGFFRVFSPKKYTTPSEVLPIIIFSAIPILVRQYGHYFLLIAPWSYLAAAAVLRRIMGETFLKQKEGIFLLQVTTFCLIVLLPIVLYLSPSFYDITKQVQMAFVGIFISLILIAHLLWVFLSGQARNFIAYLLVLFIVLGIESAYLALKIPFRELRNEKNAQIAEAQVISNTCKSGSTVFVIDRPELYVLCNFHNPLNNYSFIYPYNQEFKLKSIDYNIVQNIIVKKDNPFVTSGFFEKKGYKRIKGILGRDMCLFTRLDQ